MGRGRRLAGGGLWQLGSSAKVPKPGPDCTPSARSLPYYLQIINSVQNEGASLQPLAPGDLPAGPFQGYPAYVALMQRCFARDPGQRPEMKEVTERLKALLHEEVLIVTGGGSAAGSAASAT